MALVNRDKDPSEQKEVLSCKIGSNNGATISLVTGNSYMAAIVPYPCTLQSVRGIGLGVSTAPLLSFKAVRYAGSATAIALSISSMVLMTAGSTSAGFGYSGLAAAGSTLLNLQANDVLCVGMDGSNSAAAELLLEFVVKKTQDIVAYNGVST